MNSNNFMEISLVFSNGIFFYSQTFIKILNLFHRFSKGPSQKSREMNSNNLGSFFENVQYMFFLGLLHYG